MADAGNKLREFIEKIARENGYAHPDVNIEPINSGGANFTSILFLVTIKSTGKKDLKLFAKMADPNENLREIVNARRLYECEEYFYNDLAKIYKGLEAKHSVPFEEAFVAPKFFGSSTELYDEVLVVENLVARGYKVYNRFEPIEWDHAVAAVEALARFHALSFAFQKENPERFEKVCEDLVFEINIKEDDPRVEHYRLNIVKQTLDILGDEHKGPVAKCLQSLGKAAYYKFWEHLGTKVIVHGDYRPSNLLFKRVDNKLHTIPVDYQGIKASSPVVDLIYFEVLSTDGAFRAEHHDRLVALYYSELTAALQRLHVDVAEVYPRDVFERELKQLYPFSIVLGMSLLPLVLAAAQHHPGAGDGSISSFLVPRSAQFARRFAELVADNIAWGLI